jgi:hypothetical protein
VIRQDGRIVAEHHGPQTRGLAQRCAFKDWLLPSDLECVRRKLASSDDQGRIVDPVNPHALRCPSTRSAICGSLNQAARFCSIS